MLTFIIIDVFSIIYTEFLNNDISVSFASSDEISMLNVTVLFLNYY